MKRKGFATFLTILPLIALALGLTAIYAGLEKERLESQLTSLQAARQRQVDSVIKKSFKETLEFASEAKVKTGIPCKDAITLAAYKISGLYVATPDSWQGFLTKFYAEQGVKLKFYVYYDSYTSVVIEMPLTSSFYIPELGVTVGGASLILTCNEATGEVTNDANLLLQSYLKDKPAGIKYKAHDEIHGVQWEEKIPTAIYRK